MLYISSFCRCLAALWPRLGVLQYYDSLNGAGKLAVFAGWLVLRPWAHLPDWLFCGVTDIIHAPTDSF